MIDERYFVHCIQNEKFYTFLLTNFGDQLKT